MTPQDLTRAFLVATGVLLIGCGYVNLHHPMNAGLFAGCGLAFFVAARKLNI